MRRSITRQLLSRAIFAGACATMVLATPAAAQLRFYSKSEEDRTTSLSAELEKARVAHLAALDAHRTYLVEALQRERSLLVQRELAERDALITLILSAKARGEDPYKLLGDQIDDEWLQVAGTLPKPVAYTDFMRSAPARLLRNRARRTSAQPCRLDHHLRGIGRKGKLLRGGWHRQRDLYETRELRRGQGPRRRVR